MSIDRNKEVAREFFARFTAGDIAGVLDSMTDDATWWLPGKPEQLPILGVQNKEQMARLFHAMTAQLENGLKMTVKSVIAEGDKVALEAESYGQLRNGRVYNQEYHFAMTIRDGKVSAVREYLDTQHVFATWFQP
jgi:uncharacterized protein